MANRSVKFDVMLKGRFVCTLSMEITPPQNRGVDRQHAGTEEQCYSRLCRGEVAFTERQAIQSRVSKITY